MHNLLKTALFLIGLGLWIQMAAAQSGEAQRRTIWSGVFNEEQAARGEKSYGTTCARCHLPDLSGKNGPSLKGERFVEAYRESALEILFNTVKSMPPNNSNNPTPRLPDPVYLDIMTFLLKGNGAPAGTQELTLEVLPTVQFEKKTGPEPIPNLALVSVVGCLAQTSPTAWTVTQGSEPIRTMAPDEVLPVELKAGTTRALGANSYRLAQVDRIGSSLDPYKDQKVQVKGNLVRQVDQGSRLNLTAIATVAGTCQ